MRKIFLPVLPNAPLLKLGNFNSEGDFKLRRHKNLMFVENSLFCEEKLVYRDTYQNDQSNSEIFKLHMMDVYQMIKDKFPKDSKLVEVGCGKGKFLEIVKCDGHFDYRGFDTSYEGDDQRIQKRYLTELDKIDANVVVLRHTLEHVPSPHLFLSFLSKVFPPSALIFIEVPQFEWTEENKAIFDFTYEHVNYFNTHALRSFFSSTITNGNFFGGQYQYLLAHFSSLNLSLWENYTDEENWENYDFSKYYVAFKRLINPLKKFKRIWIWGAATKGVLFLKHLSDLDRELFKSIVGIVDTNPMKQGCFTPSTSIEVSSPKCFFKASIENDSVMIVLNPNYFAEITALIRENAPYYPTNQIINLCPNKNFQETYTKQQLTQGYREIFSVQNDKRFMKQGVPALI